MNSPSIRIIAMPRLFWITIRAGFCGSDGANPKLVFNPSLTNSRNKDCAGIFAQWPVTRMLPIRVLFEKICRMQPLSTISSTCWLIGGISYLARLKRVPNRRLPNNSERRLSRRPKSKTLVSIESSSKTVSNRPCAVLRELTG